MQRLLCFGALFAVVLGAGHYTCHCNGAETMTTGTCTEGCPYGTGGDLAMNFRGECPWTPVDDLGDGWVYTDGEHKLDVDTITMFAWINPHTCDISSDRAIILNKESLYEMGLQNGNCALQSAFSPCWRWWGTEVIPLNTWTHVAVVFDGTNEVHYINGIQVESTTCGSGNTVLAKNDEDFKIGARGGDSSTGSQFDGDIDDVWLFDTALSAEEILQWYTTFSDFGKWSGLVAHWRLDGNGDDSSGNGHHGVPVSPDWVTGKVNQAFHLNGADEVDVEDSSDNALDVNTLTVIAWVNPHTYTISSDRAIIINKESTYEMGIQAGVGAFQSALSPCWRWWGTVVVPMNAWTQVALVYDGLNEIHYFNGVEVERTTCGSGGPLANNNNDFKIGARGGDSGTGSSAFDGDIDEVMLFDRYLDPTEILQFYEDSVGMAKIENLVGHWALDGNADDSSPNAHHGEAVNPEWVDGKIDQAFKFNGADEVDIHEDGVSSLDVDSMTAFMYINPHTYSVTADRGILFNKESTYEMGLQSGTGALQSALSPCWRWWGTYVIPLDQWSWIGLVYDATTGAEVHYVNGVEVERTTCGSGGSLTNNDQDLKIGARGGDGSTSSQFIGDLDDFWLFARAMDASEMRQWYMTLQNVAGQTGVVAHYPLNGDAMDDSVHQLHGTVNNGEWVTGKIDQAFRYSGGDDAIVVADAGDGKLDVTTVTLMAWVNPHSFGSSHSIIINKENTYEYALAPTSGVLQSAFSPCWRWWGTTAVPLNQWSHVAVVYDGLNEIHYLNGIETERTTCGSAGGTLTNNDQDFKIGARGGDGTDSSQFVGDIDEVWVFDHYLDGITIQQMYWDQIGQVSDQNVVGHWTLDGHGDDDSGNGLDGVVSNPEWVDGKIDDAFHFNGDDSVTVTDNRGVRSEDYRWSCSLTPDCVVAGSPGTSSQQAKLQVQHATPKYHMGGRFLKNLKNRK